MKWINRGHEYDEQYQNWQEKNIYIWGGGEIGNRILKELMFDKHIKAVIDTNKKGVISTIPIISPDKFFMDVSCDDSILILAFTGADIDQVRARCEKYGYDFGRNLFIADREFELYKLPKILVYLSNKVFFYACGVNVTERCTLKCKECTMSIPYIQEPSDLSLETLTKDIDTLFSKVDYVKDLQLLGGEPFLNPNLSEFIRYLREKYESRTGRIVIYTNGTVELSDSILKILRESDVLVRLSDYSNISVPIAKRQEHFLNQLAKNGVRSVVLKLDFWTPYGFEKNIRKTLSENQMIDFFDSCKPGCWTIHHKKLFYCYCGHMATRRLNILDDHDNYIDLEKDIISAKELVEWYDGFSANGYKEICRYCDGEYTMNSNRISVAEQIE